MTYALMGNRRFTVLGLGLILAVATAAYPAGGQTRTAQTTTGRNGWDFRSEMVGGRPVFKVVRLDGGAETTVYEIGPDDVPFKETDCGLDCRETALPGCFGRCLMGGLEMLLFDEAHETAYVAGGTESGRNAHVVLFKLDVRTGQLVRIGDTFASDLQEIRMSPDGRYLSYLAASSNGADNGAWLLQVLNLETGVETSATDRLWKQGREAGVIVNVSSYKWQDASTVAFTADTRPSRASDGKRRPRGMPTQYLYSAAEDTLMTARERRVIP
jgi:hypothetical protein